MNSTARLRVPVTLLALAAFAVAANAVPPLLTTLAAEFGIPVERFGFAFFVQYASFAVASTIIASVTRGRFGTAILIGALTVSALLFLIGPEIRSFTAMLIWFIPLGLTGGFTETQATIILGRDDGDGSSRLVSLSQAFFCAGAIVAPQIVSALLSRAVPWEQAFLLFAGIIGVVALLVAFVLPIASAKARRGKSSGSRSEPGTADIAASEANPVDHASAATRRRDRLLLSGFAAAMFFYVVAEGSLVAWTAAYFELRFGMTASNAAMGLSVFWFGVLTGRVVVFFLPERWTLWPVLLVASFTGTVAVAVAATVSQAVAAAVAIGGAGVLLGPVWPVLVSTGRSVLRSEGAVATIVTAGAVGVAVGPFVSSRFIVLFGIERLLLFVAASAGAVFVIVYTLKKKPAAARSLSAGASGYGSNMRYQHTGNVHKDFHLGTATTIAYILDRYGRGFLEELFERTATRVYRDIHQSLLAGEIEPFIEHLAYYYDREKGVYRIDRNAEGVDFVVDDCPAVRHVLERQGEVPESFYLQFELLAQGFSTDAPVEITWERTGVSSYVYRVRPTA